MKITGSYSIEAPRDEVWNALNDIEVLARTIPGCQKLEQIGEHSFESTLKIGLAAVKGIYHGTVTLSDIQPPHHYKMTVNGKGSNGFLHGEGGIELTEEDGKTTIYYTGEANVGGALATTGQRLIEGASRTLINQSLKALTAQIQERLTTPASIHHTPEGVALVVDLVHPHHPEPAATSTESNGMAAPPTLPEAPAESVRRSVIVPEHEQLKPEALVSGVVQDFLKEKPWFPWVIVAFLLGLLIGRRR